MLASRSTTRSVRSVAVITVSIAALALGAAPSIASAQYPHVAVIHVDPATYSPTSPDARADAARTFFASHRDAYDFLVVFPTFPLDRSASVPFGEAEGRHFVVRNAVNGIGLPLSAAPQDFGSSRLKGFIDQYALVPGGGQSFETALMVVAHEIAHQWSGRALFRDRRTGQVSQALLGLEQAHWSYYLDSDASVLYGADWLSGAGGQYAAAATLRRYSALDLYLMGALAPEELQPFALLEPTAGAATPAASLSPAVGTRITASPFTISVADLVAAMGPRIPSSIEAQASFRVAFVIASQPGQDPTSEQLAFVESVRKEWANRFFYMTHGRAVMETDLVEPASAALAGSPSVQLGVGYLLSRQLSDGSWADDPSTAIRDTQAAIEALAPYLSRTDVSEAIARAVAFLQTVQPLDVDESARRALALRLAGVPLESTASPFDLGNANADDGFGLVPGYGSTVIDTTLAALASSGNSEAALEYLLRVQNGDRGWGLLAGGPSDIATTALVLHLFSSHDSTLQDFAAARTGALAYLQDHRSWSDGRFLEADVGEDRTAEAILALTEWNAASTTESQAAASALLAGQWSDGSWDGSVPSTGAALRALRVLLCPNLAIRPSEITLSSASVSEGQPASALVVVRNQGSVDARNVVVQAFDGTGATFGPATTIPIVHAGSSTVATVALESGGHAGATQAFIVVDPADAIDETTKEDNRVAVAFSVSPRPTLPDLFVAAGSVTATPGSITRVATPITVSARIGNSGMASVPEVTVALLSGATVIASRSVSLPAASDQLVSLDGTLPTTALSSPITVVVDPGSSVQEASKANNSALVTLQILPTVDLAVHLASITPNPVDPGRDLTVRFDVSNRGTTTAASAPSAIELLDGSGAVVATVNGAALSVPSGGTVSASAIWRASTASAVAARVTVSATGDLDPSDNVALGSFAVRESGQPNLAFRGAPVIEPSPPLEGRPAQVTVTVQNTGRTAAAASAVALWLGDPAHGGQQGGRVALPALDGGASASVVLPVASAPGKAMALVARVDPDSTVSEYDENDNDAVLYIEPLGRPDLALVNGSIQPSSLFPRRGDRVSVKVAVDNIGGQAVGPSVLELYAGAPETGGVRIGSAHLAGIDPHGETEASFEWDTTPTAGTIDLVAVVNGDGYAEDARADNDRSKRTVVVQGGDLALSDPYFSPDGNGIKDSTELFFRPGMPGAVEVAIRDERGHTVRRLRGTARADGSGSVTWDGRTDAGSVAFDGTYRMDVSAAATLAPLGTVNVVIDTNRSSVLAAPRELQAPVRLDEFFRSQVPPAESNFTLTLVGMADEGSAIYYYTHENAVGATSCAYYRVPLDGGTPDLLTPPEFECTTFGSSALSPDGRSIFRIEPSDDWLPIVTRYDLTSQVRTVLITTDTVPLQWSLWLDADGQSLVIPTDTGAVSYDLATGALRTASTPASTPIWTQDGTQGLFAVEETHGMELHASNADGSGEHAVLVVAPIPHCLQMGPGETCVRWEPEPIPTPPGAYVLPEGVSFGAFTWVSSTEVAYEADGVWLLDLTTGLPSLLIPPEVLQSPVARLLADPAGRNVAVVVQGIRSPQLWAVNLATEEFQLVAGWGLPQTDLNPSFTRFGSALASDAHCNRSRCEDYAIDVYNRGNLGLSVTGTRQSGTAELVFRGTAADLNLESWKLEARRSGNAGASITVATGTASVVEGELARWVAPEAGSWEITLTGRDLAGNTRAVSSIASWAEVPAIANVRAEPQIFSPNGDGTQDDVAVRYSVQEPVTTTFTISTVSGQVVRAIPASHASTGDFSLSWDGRDDAGTVPEDGSYVIASGGSRTKVILDRTPPDVSLALGTGTPPVTFILHAVGEVSTLEPTSACTKPAPTESQLTAGRPYVEAALNVRYKASDAHLIRWQLERTRTAAADRYEVLWAKKSAVDEPMDDAISFVDVRGADRLRISAWDGAGNAASADAVEVPEIAIVTSAGAAYVADAACTGSGPRYDLMKPISGADRFNFTPAYHAFAFASTSRNDIVSASIAYHLDGQSEAITDQVHSYLGDHDIVFWDARGVSGAVVDLNLLLIDATGRTFVVPVPLGSSSGDVSTDLELCSVRPVPSPFTFDFTATGKREAVDTMVLRVRDVDSQVISDLSARLLSRTETAGVVRAHYAAEVDPDSLEGCSYEVLTQAKDGAPKVRGSFDVCGLTLVHTEQRGDGATASFRSRYRKPVARVDFYLANGSGPRELVGSVPGFDGMSPPVTLDLSHSMADTLLNLSASTYFVDGTSREESSIANGNTCSGVALKRPSTQVQVQATRLPVPICSGRAADWSIDAFAKTAGDPLEDLTVQVAAPGQGARVLTAAPIVPAPAVTTETTFYSATVPPGTWSITAQAREADGSTVVSQAATVQTLTVPPQALYITAPQSGHNACPVQLSTSMGQRQFIRVEGRVIDDAVEATRLLFRCGAGPANPAELRAAPGAIGLIDITGRGSGDCELTLEATDSAGASYCSVPTSFHLVAGGNVQSSLVPALISPNGDAVLDLATLSIGVGEPSSVVVTGTDSRGRSGVALQATVPAGQTHLTWSGTLDGAVAADGDVSLHVAATDPCGNTSTADVVARLDTTPPLVRIDSPAPGAQLGGLAVVSGTVSDENLLDYDVAIGAGTAPQSFSNVAHFDRPANGVIAEVPTSGLAPGTYTIRVLARDRAGNSSPANVTIQVTPHQIINTFSVVPQIVSLEPAVAEYELLAAGTVSLDVVDSSGSTLASVFPGTPTLAGVGQIDIPQSLLARFEDGTVSLRLRVSTGALEEAETRSLTLDRARPDLSIDSPAAGAVVADARTVTGTVRDDHMDAWSLSMSRDGSTTMLAGGRASASGDLATLPSPTEGAVALTLEARDLAGNSRTVQSNFTIDRTRPVVSLESPGSGTWVSGRQGPIAVSGSVSDSHLASVRLELTTPGASRELFSGSALPSSGVIAEWDTQSDTDGPAELKLTATDAAGNEADASIAVNVDRTPPIALLTSPRNSFLHPGESIAGTATDDNLTGWTLELTSGPPSTTSIWTPLVSGTAPVQEDVLTALSSLPRDGVYGLRLSVTDRAGNVSVDEVPFQVDSTPPQPPSAVVARLLGPDVQLTWTASADADVVAYQVQRAGPTGVFTPVGTTANTFFSDAGIRDGEYGYVVVAIDGAGLGSKPSGVSVLSVDRQAPRVAIDAPVEGSRASGMLVVRGTAFAASDFKEYRLAVGTGAAPETFTLVRRSGVPVTAGELGQVDLGTWSHGSVVTVRLQGEDLSGNVSEARATVTVDSVSPDAPVLVAATAAGSSVRLDWLPSPSPDVRGYLVYRNGTIANLPAGVSGQPSAYLLPATATSYTDGALADGSYAYEVQALDAAGNASTPSNSITVEVETTAPRAAIATPEPLARLTGPVEVTADIHDQDVAQVQFEARAGTGPFEPLGPPARRVPFRATLDPSSFSSPVIEVRAVATDAHGNTDTRPESIFVFDAPKPAAPGVAATVSGSDVNLRWSDASPAGLVVGYEVTRDGTSVAPPSGPLTGSATASNDQDTAPLAFDGNSWTMWMSTEASAWWRIDLDHPTLTRALDLSLFGARQVEVSVSILGTWVPVYQGVAIAATHVSLGDGLEIEGIRTSFAGTSLGPVGLYEVALDSRPVEPAQELLDAAVRTGSHSYAVSAVTRFGASATSTAGARVYAPSLDAVPEVAAETPLHVSGTGAAPRSTVILSRGGVAVATVTATEGGAFGADVPLVDGPNVITAVAVDPQGNRSLPSGPVAVNFDAAPEVSLSLRVEDVASSSIRLSFEATGETARVAGFHVRRSVGGGAPVVTDLGPTARTVTDAGLSNGTYRYTLTAYNAHGVEGGASNAVDATIAVEPPPAVASLSVAQIQGYPALRLTWPAGAGSFRFLVERASTALGPFSPINGDRLASTPGYVDSGLAAGSSYYYRVRAVDSLGNAGAPSPIASGTPLAGTLARPSIFAPTSPGMPIDVDVTSVEVSGLVDPGMRVELRSNGSWVGEATAGVAELYGQTLAGSSGSGGFGVSADGTTVASLWSWRGREALTVNGPSVGLWIEDPGLREFGRVRFSADGRWIAFEARATDDGRMHVWVASTQDGGPRRVSADAGEERAPAWSPDSTRVAYEAQRDGQSCMAIGVASVETSGDQLLTSSGEDLLSPGWTSEGGLLAVARAGGAALSRVVRHDADSWHVLFEADSALAALVTSPVGSQVAVLGESADAPLLLLDLATGEAWSADSTPATSRQVAFASDGKTLFQVRDGEMLRTVLVTQETETLGSIGPVDALAGTTLGPVALLGTGEVTLYRYGGVFTLAAVPLFAGENLLVATAMDGAGGRSAPSEPVSVTVARSEFADLAVTSVATLPGVPVVGDPVNAVVTIRNGGGKDAPPSSLLVKHMLPDGTERELTPIAIGAIPSGGSTSAVVPLGVVAAAGSHEVIAIADAASAFQDPDRQNNLVRAAFTVAASRDIQVAVTADPVSAPVNGQFTARVTVQNPGAPVNATLVARLADASGGVVYETSPAAYHPLAGGTSTSFQAVLPVASAVAGNYRIVAMLSAAGSAPVFASTPVTVQPERSVSLSLAADRFRYEPSGEVSLVSVVTNLSRNAALTGATHRLQVLDATGVSVFTAASEPVPATWMGGSSSLATTVAAATLGAGYFVAHAWVEQAGTILAESSTELTVVAAPALLANLDVAGQGDPPVVAAGSPAAVTASFRNAGTMSVQPTTGRIMVLDPATGDVLLTQDLTVPGLDARSAAVRTLAIPTAGLALHTYSLALVVDVDGVASTLASAQFRVADGSPPRLTVQSPTQEIVVPGVLQPTIRAQDGATGVALVRASVGGSVTLLARADGSAVDGIWTGPIALGADGTYTVVFSAVDGEGNDGLLVPVAATDPITLTVVSDRTPPRLHVDGVVDGSLLNAPAVWNVSAEDAHLAFVTADIDGTPYLPGSAYGLEGSHVFRAVAVDLAGNRSTDVRLFTIDRSPPQVAIAGLFDGQYLDAPVTPAIVVTDQEAAGYSATLDGVAWSGTAIASEGRHLLVVDAQDSAGNTQHVETGFWIDLTPPSLTIAGVEAGACYAHPVTPTIDAEDANLGGISSTLDGQPFTSGTVVSQEGSHTLAAAAFDKAGHKATGAVPFSVDGSAPVIAIPELDERFFAQPVTINFSVTDATAITTSATLDGAPVTAGAVVSAEGRHVVSIRAQDCAGNVSSRTAAFVIDRTAPTLVLLGVVDGSIVAGPVSITASAGDANLTSVTLELDGAPYVEGTPITSPGAHVVTGRAVDAAGNFTPASLGFTIDGLGPRITVDGVAGGDVLDHPVTPIVNVKDDDLAGWDMSVDDVLLLPGATITAEGKHRLIVNAHDLAGNRASVTIDFVIDLTPPVPSVGGVADGLCYARDVAPTFSAHDANLASVAAVLDGAAFSSGTTVSVEGDYSMIVTARDLADHIVPLPLTFVVDKTPPEVSIRDLDGRFFAGPVTPSYSVSDLHLASTTVTVDGSPLASGSKITAEGVHTLVVGAEDCAANGNGASAVFTIDLTKPVVTLSGVADGAVVAGQVSISATAADRTSTTISLTLDGVAYVPGTAIAAQGRHVVKAVATDAAGNQGGASKEFTIDNTPPTIEVRGLPDSGITNRDVTLEVKIGDPNLAGWTATVDGAELAADGVVSAEGVHTLVVTAHDRAGSEVKETFAFEIDKTPPEISASVSDGGGYAAPLVVTYTATDAHLDTVRATLDGASFASGGAIDGAGSHVLLVTARDTAGSESRREYGFTVSGPEPTFHVTKRVATNDVRVLARVACGWAGESSAAFLARALPEAHVSVVRNDVDLLMGLRSGQYDLVVVTDQVGVEASFTGSVWGDASASCVSACPPTGWVPPLCASEVARRLQAELTEAVHRGLGLLVFRTSTAAEPWLREALGLQFSGREGLSTVTVLPTAVSGALQLKVVEGVALKLDDARSIATFKSDGKVAAAIHGHGLGEVVVLGFDPVTSGGGAEALVAGAAAFAFTESEPLPGGVATVRIELKNDGAQATRRIREHLGAGLLLKGVRDGGAVLSNGDLEWTLSQGAGQVNSVEYLVKLPEVAGTYQATSEVARMVSGQGQAPETFPLSITVAAGASELQVRAETLAAAMLNQGCNKYHRQAVLSDLARVRSNAGRTAQQREDAIGALLDAADHVKAVQGVDATPLRLAIDSLLAVWEARP